MLYMGLTVSLRSLIISNYILLLQDPTPTIANLDEQDCRESDVVTGAGRQPL